MKKASKKSSDKNRYEVIELPSNNKDMEEYVTKHRNEINEQIIESIGYALSNHMTGIELFCFKNSNFVVMLHRKDFKESLENILEFGLSNQQFELCTKTKKLIEKFDKLGFVVQYKLRK